MGAFLSIGRGALFFAPRGGKCCDGLEARSRPSISWSARDVAERSLVKAEAAGGGGRRPAFTRVCSYGGFFVNRARRFFRSSRRGVLRLARGPLPAFDLLVSARCR